MRNRGSGPQSGIPKAFTSRALNASDNGANLICATAQVMTVNTGLPLGFGCLFDGTVSLDAASTATVTDIRTTGATNPECALLQTGTDTYKLAGSKA